MSRIHPWAASALRVLVVAVLAVTVATCGGDSSSPTEVGSPGGLFDIGGTWAVVGQSDHTFTLQCPACPARVAEFEGTQRDGGVLRIVTGDFENGVVILIALDPFNPLASEGWGGFVVDADTMDLTMSDQEALERFVRVE